MWKFLEQYGFEFMVGFVVMTFIVTIGIASSLNEYYKSKTAIEAIKAGYEQVNGSWVKRACQ